MNRAERSLAALLLAAVFGVPAFTLHAFVTHLAEANSFGSLLRDPGLLGISALGALSLAPAALAGAVAVRRWRAETALGEVRAAGQSNERWGMHFTVVPSRELIVCLAGWRAPAILVSTGALERMTPDMLQAALLHEEAHRRAADHRWRLVVTMLGAAFGLIPGAGRLMATMVLRSELAADNRALACGAGQRDLFEAIILCADPGLALPALGGAQIEVRLTRIADPAASLDAALPRLPLAGLSAWVVGLPLVAHALLVAGILCHPAMG